VLLSLAILSVHVPGSYTQDSLYTLNEALTTPVGQLNEWLSPAYASIWKAMILVAAAFHASPFFQMSTMCVLQTLLIIGALIRLLHSNSRMTWWGAAGVAAAVASWPAIFVYFGEVWRDVLMAALLLVAVGLLDSVRRRRSRGALVAAIGVLFLGGLMRQNAIAAEMPLFLWASLLWPCGEGMRKRRLCAMGMAAALTVGIAASIVMANRLLASTNVGRVTSATICYDLMGISVRANALLVPRSLTVPEYTLLTVRSRYQDEYGDLTGVVFPSTGAEMKTLAAVWARAVVTHPTAYLQHRWSVTSRLLGISGMPHLAYFYGIPQTYYPRYVSDRAYYVPFPDSGPRRWVAGRLARVRNWAFRPWIYGLMTIGVLLLDRKRVEAPFWLCASAGLYWVSFFFSAPSTDFRYSWWGVLAVMTALALVGVRTAGGRPWAPGAPADA